MIDFTEFPKIPRLRRECFITEKIDGTNAVIYVPEDGSPLLFGSRTRWITPDDDNHGFARWAEAHEAELRTLGQGLHFGEWWGPGINRGYGLREKVFSLFNVVRWSDTHDDEIRYPTPRPSCCSVVPLLYKGPFTTGVVDLVLEDLERSGSLASPGFLRPEGVVVWHEAARAYFKVTLGNDGVGEK